MSHHPFVHIELSANDRESAGEFYSKVFGWKIHQIPEMNYATFTTGEGDSVGGGLNPVGEQTSAGTVTVYINTDDIIATMATIEANGGKILYPKTEIPTVGWFALFSDPTGNQMALLQPLMEK
jgi:hypothetical protein